jgi:hypothetical protein
MATPTVKFKNVKIKAVKPYDNNPRENSGAVGYVPPSMTAHIADQIWEQWLSKEGR